MSQVLPKTKKAKVASILVLISIMLFIIGVVLPYEEGFSGIDIVTHNFTQFFITILISGLGIVAFVLGITALAKDEERSVITVVAIVIAAYNAFSIIGVILNILL